MRSQWPDEVAAERAARLLDLPSAASSTRSGGLVLVERVPLDEAELDCRRRHALLEVGCVEAEAVAEELDDVIVAPDE
jgi:hypothetical protein